MKVAVLTVGRSGSMSLYHACQKVRNFTVGHDTKVGKLASDRVIFPDKHIEIDTRFAWMLGLLDEKNKTNIHYAFLTRTSDSVASSYNQRWANRKGIMRAYCEGILQRDKPASDLNVASDLVGTAEANIRTFLLDRPHTIIRLESWREDLKQFYADIGADVDFEGACSAFAERHNVTRRNSLLLQLRYRVSICLDMIEEFLKRSRRL